MNHKLRFQGFTLIEYLVVISIIALLIGILLPAMGAARRTASGVKQSANLRGIAQSFAIFGNTNKDFLPGLNAKGNILAPSLSTTGSATHSGAAITSRMWILLNGQYIGGDILLNPQDSLSKWISGQSVSSQNFSYTGLPIASGPSAMNTDGNHGRAEEWKSSAYSKAVFMSDRIYSGTSDATIQSVWTSTAGDWKGNLVWGDVHAEFAQTYRGFHTVYASTVNTSDHLFATQTSPDWNEPSAVADANAMMITY